MFSGGETSPLLEMVNGARSAALKSEMYRARLDETTPVVLGLGLRGLIDGWGGPEWYIDKNRAWLSEWDLLSGLFDPPKVVIMVRDPRGICASLEKRMRRHGVEMDPVMQPTIDERVLNWMTQGVVGISLKLVFESVKRGFITSCHVVRAEDLTQSPGEVIQGIYRYIEKPLYDHDMEFVDQVIYEHDIAYGMRGLHDIKNTICPIAEDFVEVLGEDVCARLRANNSWFYDLFYPDRQWQ